MDNIASQAAPVPVSQDQQESTALTPSASLPAPTFSSAQDKATFVPSSGVVGERPTPQQTAAAGLAPSLLAPSTTTSSEGKDPVRDRDTKDDTKDSTPQRAAEICDMKNEKELLAPQTNEQTPDSPPPPTATSQTQQTEEQASSSKAAASRFSVNLSGVGLPAMASNLGLTQANSERAADMAQDLKKNVVNMWHAWFPTPPASSASSASTAAARDAARPSSGTQSLSHHPSQAQRPAKALRTNSYTLGATSGGETASVLAASESATPTRASLDSSNSSLHKKNVVVKDATTRIVHEANDPVATQSSTCAAPTANVNNGPIYLMGKLYPPSPTQWADFQRDFTAGLIWCTYRHSYPPIKPSNFTTDVGWGCMLRSGQGLLANALAILFMGRGWNRPMPGDPMWDIYVKILSWFLDDMNAKSPFSVHRIALLGKQLGKNIGEWFGPSTTSQVTKALVHNFPESGLSVYVTTDGVIYKDQVEEAATQKKAGGFGHLLILVTIRLGIDKLNPIYNDAIKTTFEFPQSLGIAGGRPSSSYYFVGYQGDDLFYLDPHHSRCVVETKDLNEYTAEDFATYHCETIRKIDINAIDPSMLLAFYCKDRSDFDAFCERVKELNARPGMGSSIFTIGEKAPDYEDDDGTRLLSVADEDDEDLELIL
ncbi:Cysteine protease atg4 [Mortierella claussenii]|nr:Cysteine protease atg4 [Mortierella claussenii]